MHLTGEVEDFAGHGPSYSCGIAKSYRAGGGTTMRIDRRKALALLGMGAVATPAAGQLPKPLGVTFQHGVASGDSTQDRVMLWTRITPENGQGQIAYTWKLNPLDRRAGGARSGSGVTGADRDFTVKVDVTGLDAGR